jgi:hypothetical protein
VFRSLDDLKAAIDRFVAETNADPKTFVWTAKPTRILAAVKRGKEKLESILETAAAAAVAGAEVAQELKADVRVGIVADIVDTVIDGTGRKQMRAPVLALDLCGCLNAGRFLVLACLGGVGRRGRGEDEGKTDDASHRLERKRRHDDIPLSVM